MKQIKVEIDPYNDYPKNLSLKQEYFESFVVGKLRKAGIPVIGILSFNGLKNGTLTRTDDIRSNKIIYTWINKTEKETEK